MVECTLSYATYADIYHTSITLQLGNQYNSHAINMAVLEVGNNLAITTMKIARQLVMSAFFTDVKIYKMSK